MCPLCPQHPLGAVVDESCGGLRCRDAGCRGVGCSKGAPTEHRGAPFGAMAGTGQNPREDNEVFHFDIMAGYGKLQRKV